MAKYRFEQIAINKTEKKKPEESDYATYIGLEHLDSGCLKVTRWGSDVPIKGEKLVMKKGDVLLGKRNAYLRRAAIAPHDGIFSAHGMILNPREDVIDKDFFPLFIASNYFFDEAIKISVGSLSPTINWRDLSRVEFELPPLDEQRKLAQLLWAINDVKDGYRELLIATDAVVKSQFIEMFGNPIMKEKDESLPTLGEVCILKAGKFVKADSIKEKQEDGLFPCFGGNGLRGYVPSFNQEGEFPLIGRQGALCGNVQYAVGKFHATEHAVVVTPNIEMDRFWLYHLLCLLDLNRYASGAAQPGLAVNKLEAIRVFVPDLQLQKQYSEFAKQSDKSKFEIQQALKELELLYDKIIEEGLTS